MSGGKELVNIKFRGQGAVVRALNSIRDTMTRQSTLQMIAEEAVALIKARTLEGLDAKGRPLIPSKRAERDGGQTLSDQGLMLGALVVQSVSPKRATIGFGNQIESRKALWAHEGTKAHIITAKPGGVLAFAASLSSASSIVNTRGGKRKARRLTMGNATSGGRGMTLAQHVHHPGTPPRPFFGISPRDTSSLQAIALDYIAKAVQAEKAGA